MSQLIFVAGRNGGHILWKENLLNINVIYVILGNKILYVKTQYFCGKFIWTHVRELIIYCLKKSWQSGGALIFHIYQNYEKPHVYSCYIVVEKC